MIASQGSGIGSLPKLQGHVVAQLHASMTSPRMRHEVSAAMTRLLLQYRMDCWPDRAGFQARPIVPRREPSFDPKKNAKNIAERGLSFERVAELDWDTAIVREDTRRNYREPRSCS
jgi:hypothetical protein